MDWPDVVRAALAFFLVATGGGIAYVCVRLGNTFGSMSSSVRRVTDETVPILSHAQTTVEKVNLELSRVDELMLSAVGATKGAERAVGSVAGAVATPVRKVTGVAAKAQQQLQTFRARRQAREHDAVSSGVSAKPTDALSGATKVVRDAIGAVKQAVGAGPTTPEWSVPLAGEETAATKTTRRTVELPYPSASQNGMGTHHP